VIRWRKSLFEIFFTLIVFEIIAIAAILWGTAQ
jgi:hypothetical protein